MLGNPRKEAGGILKAVYQMIQATIIKAATMPAFIHMYVSIPPKQNTSKHKGRIDRKKRVDDIRQTS